MPSQIPDYQAKPQLPRTVPLASSNRHWSQINVSHKTYKKSPNLKEQSLATNYYVATYKTIQVYYLNKSHVTH